MTTEPETATEAPAPATITPEEIQRQEFGVSRFGGYKMRDVDEFLDRLTESTQALVAENERLRGGGGPIVGTPDLDDVNRQADEILTRAREEAARIVAEAGTRGGGDPVAPAVAATAAGRAAVDPFLMQERDFLQRLATLVQAHAESVKDMARKTRQAPAAAEAAPAVAAPKAEPAKTDAAPKADTASEPEPEAAPNDEAAAAAEDDTDMVDVRAEAEADDIETTENADERGEEVPAGDARGRDGDPSLRSLFWGEEN